MPKIPVVSISGDGVGPEIMQSVRLILEAVQAPIELLPYVAGKVAFESGIASGLPDETVRAIRTHQLALKAPLETPIGYGERSANVNLRKACELFGNIRPVKTIPGIKTVFSGQAIDMIVVRENLEDLYSGLEYMQGPDIAQTLKIHSEKSCIDISELACQLCLSQNRSHIHVITKANIMKLTEGLMKRSFEKVVQQYPITHHHMLVDNCAHQLVINPSQFDVIVTNNMNGDILSDLCSGLVGGLGLAPSMNVGNNISIFEAVHGSAPDIAGKDIVNPTALIQSVIMMCRHIGCPELATIIESALFKTISDGIGTIDIQKINPVKCSEFTNAIINRLEYYSQSEIPKLPNITFKNIPNLTVCQDCSSMDLFFNIASDPVSILKDTQEKLKNSPFTLDGISNRGIPSDPTDYVIRNTVNLWIIRISKQDHQIFTTQEIYDLLTLFRDWNWVHIEKILKF